MKPDRIGQILLRLPKRIASAHRVYVIGCREFVKIGVASDVAVRLCYLQTGCPYKLSLLKVWDSADAIGDEERLHCLLEEWRVRGEWFDLPDNIQRKLLACNTLDEF